MKRILLSLASSIVAVSVSVQADSTGWSGLEFPACKRFVAGGAYDKYLDALEQGDRSAILLAGKVRCCTDASRTLALEFSLSRAILHDPDGVALMLETTFPVRRICRIPFIEASHEQERAFARNAVAALRTVKVMTPEVEQCIQEFNGILEHE